MIRYNLEDIDEVLKLLTLLRKLPGATDFSGDCSVQTLIPLDTPGKYIRIGITDNDVSEVPDALWFEEYPQL